MTPPRRGFSVIELLVAMAVAGLLVAILLGFTEGASRLWIGSVQKKDSFAEARSAFDEMGRTLAQATLNPYWAYRFGPMGEALGYGRASDLHFVCGRAEQILGPGHDGSAVFFQAPLGVTRDTNLAALHGALNAVGFFVKRSTDPVLDGLPQAATANVAGLRLLRWLQPTEDFRVYREFSGEPTRHSLGWIELSAGLRAVAGRTLALVVVANYLGPDGNRTSTLEYDSRDPSHPERLHQLPGSLRVSLLVADERSADSLPELPALPDFWSEPESVDQMLQSYALRLSRGEGIPRPVHCRVLSAEIPLVGTRWSK